MILRYLTLLVLWSVLISGCAANTTASPESTATQSDSAVAVAEDEATTEPEETNTTAAASATAAASSTTRPTRTATRTRTATAEPTETPTPSVTPEPTETPLPSNTPTPPITATPTANASGEIVHTVGQGETIHTIAAQYGVLWSQLTAYNSIAATVTPGQEIRIPTGMMSQTYVGGGRGPATPIASSSDENRVVLGPVTFDWQKLNNCGPTTTSVMLSYYGIAQPQLSIASVLKPNAQDKNVSPAEVAAFVRGQGMGAFIGINGDTALLERLLSAGYPVMVEQWMSYDGGVGHYRAVLGYDRARQQILNDDTFLGPNIWRPYAEFNRDWAYFNNTYLVFYPTADEARVSQIIGADWNRSAMWERALNTFRNQEGALARYGQAEALHQLGRSGEAVPVFEQAIAAGLPARFLWYRYGYFEALNNTAQYQKTLTASAPVLQAMGVSEDIRYHRAVAHKALGQTEQARRELTLALQDNANYAPARSLLNTLPAPQPTAAPTFTPTVAAEPSPVPPTPEGPPPAPSETPVAPPPVEPTQPPVEPTQPPPVEPTQPPPVEPTQPPPVEPTPEPPPPVEPPPTP